MPCPRAPKFGDRVAVPVKDERAIETARSEAAFDDLAEGAPEDDGPATARLGRARVQADSPCLTVEVLPLKGGGFALAHASPVAPLGEVAEEPKPSVGRSSSECCGTPRDDDRV
jgi:hypothetical protein